MKNGRSDVSGSVLRVLVLAAILSAPLIALAEDGSKNEIGFIGGGGKTQSNGCIVANLVTASGAVEYKRTIAEGQKIAVHGYYQANMFDGWKDGLPDSSYENGIHNRYEKNDSVHSVGKSGDVPDLQHQTAATVYYSWEDNSKNVGFSAGLSANIYFSFDKSSDYSNIRYFVSPVMPSAEIRLGLLDTVYLAIRYQHPDLTLNYDWAGIDMVFKSIPYMDLAAGAAYDPASGTYPWSARLGLDIKPADWISIPISAAIVFSDNTGFNATAGLKFNF